MFHLIATEKSKIKSVKDLKGKRIALMLKGSGSYTLFWTLSEHYGLKSTDFQAIELPSDKAKEDKKIAPIFIILKLSS